MGIKTEIEWCDSTLNLAHGCDGCELWNPAKGVKRCYAGNMTELYGGRPGWPQFFDKPQIFRERLDPALRWGDLRGQERKDKPWLSGLPRIIFLNDMGDTFTKSLPFNWLASDLERIGESKHQFLILTKNAAAMADFVQFFDPPKNCWFGVSVTSPSSAARLDSLERVAVLGKYITFCSFEPADRVLDFRPVLPWLDWLIAGGDSSDQAKPSHPDVFRRCRDACQEVGKPFFFKQWGRWRPLQSGDPNEATQADVSLPDRATWRMVKMTRGSAGAVLDGKEWREMPARDRVVKSASLFEGVSG